MGSCENSAEVPEPLQPQAVVDQFSGFLLNRDSEQQQLLTCLDDNVDPAGGGGVHMCPDDNAGCVRFDDADMEIFSGKRGVGLVAGSENLVDLSVGRVLDDECGVSGSYLNEMQDEVEDCDVEMKALHVGVVENRGQSDELVDCEKSLAPVVVSGSLRNCEQQEVGEKDDKGVFVQGMMEEKSVGLATVEPGAHDEIGPSMSSGMPIELMQLNGSPWNCAQLGCLKDGTSGSVQEKKGDTLASIESDACDGNLVSTQGCRMHAELIPKNSRRHAQLDDQKVDKAGSFQEIMEEGDGDLVATEGNTCDDMVPSTGCKMAQEGNQKDDGVGDRRIMEEETDSLAAIVADVSDDMAPSPFCEVDAESSPVSSSAANGDQQDSKKCDKSGCVQVVMEKKSSGLAMVDSGTSDEKVSSMGCKGHVEIIAADGFCKNCVEQDKQKYVGTSQEKVMNEKNVDLSRTRTDNDNHRAPSTTKTGWVSNLVQQDDNKVDQTIGYPFVEGPVEKRDILAPMETTASKLMSSQGFENSFELMYMSGSPEKNVRQDGQKHENCFIATYCSQKLCMEENSINMKEVSLEVSPSFHVGNSVSPQSCQLNDIDDNDSSKRLEGSDPFRKDVIGVFNSMEALGSSFQSDNEGEDDANIDCFSQIEDNNITSFQGSNETHKSGLKTLTKRAVRKCNDAARMPDQYESIGIILKAARRKRSCFSKPARSSSWGLLGNVTQNFKLSNGQGLDEIKNLGTNIATVSCRSEKRRKNRAGPQRSKGKLYTSTGCIRLKVRLGKKDGQSSLNIVVPESNVMGSLTSTDALSSDYGTGSSCGTLFKHLTLGNGVEDKVGEERKERHLQSLDDKLEKANFDSTTVDVLLANEDLEGIVFPQKSAEAAAKDVVPSHLEVQSLAVSTEKRYSDPGTSPDSEVINVVPERQVGERSQEDSSSKALAAPGGIGKKGKKKNWLPHSDNCFLEDELPCAEIINKVKPTKKRGARQRKGDVFSASGILTSAANENASTNSSSSKGLSEEYQPSSRGTELGISIDAAKVEVSTEDKTCCALDVGLKRTESQVPKHLLPLTKSKEHQLWRKTDAVRKGQSKVSGSGRSRRANSSKERKPNNKNKAKDSSSTDYTCCKVEADLNEDDFGKTNTGLDISTIDVTNLDLASSGEMGQCLPVDNAWVRCDECHKWRRIPVALVDSIGQTNCEWVCKDNTDEAFADCSIPQEKSNAEINAELGISDAEEDAYDFPSNDRGLEYRRTSVCKEYEFTRITTNQFLHRNRRSQTIDEIMVCHCKPPGDGGLGCGDECLNRMLNIECVQGTCPCGDLCSNQQFQKRNYAKMRWDRCGKKGFGLRMEDDISKGQFLIEYVGEVLDLHTYEARQKEYAFRGHKHFYFMTLDGSEVIDASAKGNLGRFINHSCDPNCRTEKWVVNGEICIGLFAVRDIKKGEEVTFDYNYVRVVGAAAKKCYCGSAQCRGYIGGDPTSTEVIDQVDSDEEFPEPVMLDDEDGGDGMKNTISGTDGDKIESSTTAVEKLNIHSEFVDSENQSASIQSSSQTEDAETSLQTKDVSNKPASADQQVISIETTGKTLGSIQRGETSHSTVLSKPSDSIVSNRKSKSTTAEDKRVFVKSRFIIKTSHQSGDVKKGKVTTNPGNVNKVQILANKSQLLPIKQKKFVESTSNGRFEAVQEKLNELLDAEGGISKRKDSPKGYLKLLLLTAASGASRNGEAIQSNRELSMILDALLKTRSRVVLMDIINKNGLRMLHNIMKQYRRDFKKIPILRKLLKVIEYLAVREILTPEHINGGPPCPGMESFTESILSLTEHDDKQVHQIARNFRDRWIPRHVRKLGYMDREDGRMEFHRSPSYNRSHSHWHDQAVRNSEAIDCVMKSKLATTVDTAICDSSSTPNMGDGTKTRKRKSRWDQPAKGDTGKLLDRVDNASKENSYCSHCFRNYSLQDGAGYGDGRLNLHDDVPPGFSSPKASSTMTYYSEPNVSHLEGPIDVVVGLPQSKFISRLPVSYGVPLPIVQQFGSPQTQNLENCAIAPGMPFHPFPPLPPFPCGTKETLADCVIKPMMQNESAEQRPLDSGDPATCCSNENNPSTTGASEAEVDISGANDHQTVKRVKGSSQDLGRRYFRQQKWNKVPPWLRNRNGWGYIGDNSRGGMCSTETESVSNEQRNSYVSQDVSCRVEKTGNYLNQHAQNLNEH